MSEIIDSIVAFQPVYRVLHREENLDFFRDVLGLKVLMEEGAMVWLGGHEEKLDRFQLEESPGLRSVNGYKKHSRTVIKAAASEIEQLLARDLEKVDKLYRGKAGYTFEAVSPENDVFLVTAEELIDLSALTEIEKNEVSFVKDENFKGLSDFAISEIDLNVADNEIIEFYESVFSMKTTDGVFDFPFVSLKLSVADGEDLSAATDETFDLEFLIFMIDKMFDLEAFSTQFEDVDGTYLDASAKTFSLEVPSHVELWFVK